ncbi:MAG: putative ubiquitin-RnfH superfamily antitoxin RatB of RatAB toxin-antitoxin module [Halieaceae bacterium]|jgi:putative ubiquitin-RnfH superfamily antitoxin RatB of RatAB toxin-antitoxin module
MSEHKMITVEVAYALPDKQQIIALEVAEGTTALEAAQQSGITKTFPEIDIDGSKMGIFGKAVKPSHYIMKAGERVEIYRPLLIDPKENRKERAAKTKAAKASNG